MPNPNRRLIAVVLDRSGSMHSVKADTEGGLRAFLAAQHEAPGETTVSLYQFDTHYEAVYENTPLAEVPAFELHPRGGTALLDAIGYTVGGVGEQLAAMDEDDRPGEVVLVILTDGQENSSREYTLARVKELLTAKQADDGWVVVFLGADQDAFTVGAGMGVAAGTTLSYSGRRTAETWTTSGEMVARGSKTGRYGFTDGERDATS